MSAVENPCGHCPFCQGIPGYQASDGYSGCEDFETWDWAAAYSATDNPHLVMWVERNITPTPDDGSPF